LGRAYGSGFPTSAGLQLNGSAQVPPGSRVLRLTERQNVQAGSAFSTEKLAVDRFTTRFDIRLRDAEADGFAFVIQGGHPAALGGSGPALGYHGDPSGRLARSVAFTFDLWDNYGEGNNATGLYLNGAMPDKARIPPKEGKNDLNGTGLDLHSGRTINVAMDYDGTELRIELKDAELGSRVQLVYVLDIPAVVGGPNAYVGFTASTGTKSATQDVLRWTFFPQ
jgi:hypothetical protein